MATLYLYPSWFFGYSIILEVLFAIISLAVAIFAFRLYRLSDQKESKLFGVSFLMISISYALQSFFNFLIVSNLNADVCRAVNVSSIILFNMLGLYTYQVFMISGLAVLLFMTFRAQNNIPLFAVLSLTLANIATSSNPFSTFYLVASICLVFITMFYVRNYLEKKNFRRFLVAVAFTLLLVAKSHLFFSVSHQVYYLIAHVLELLAYGLILWNFYLVRKR
jgi:hypothetical protein